MGVGVGVAVGVGIEVGVAVGVTVGVLVPGTAAEVSVGDRYGLGFSQRQLVVKTVASRGKMSQ
jgi:hypothetical protein